MTFSARMLRMPVLVKVQPLPCAGQEAAVGDGDGQAAWKSVDENDLIEIRAIAKTLPNAKQVLAYLEE